MKKTFQLIMLSWALVGAACGHAFAQEEKTVERTAPADRPSMPGQNQPVYSLADLGIALPAPPKIEAKAYLLTDFHSEAVLASKNPDMRVEPASLTKMMTSYIIAHELKEGKISLDDKVTVSEKAWKMPGSKMFIEVGKQVSVADLIKGMIVQSGNDATVALAEYVAGSEDVFVQLMNQWAKKLGMTHTHFANATGMPDPEHYTTPRDLDKLARALIRDFPEHYEWYKEKVFTYNGITQRNRNTLLWQDKSVDGIKTGHTSSAGYCLVASAQREGMRLISTLLGANSSRKRISESQKLLNYGFRFFETQRRYKGGQRLSDAKVWSGATDLLQVGIADDLYVTLPRGEAKNLKPVMELPQELHAPIRKGERIGTLKIVLHDRVLATRPLIALNSVEEGSFFKKLLDKFKLAFSNLMGSLLE